MTTQSGAKLANTDAVSGRDDLAVTRHRGKIHVDVRELSRDDAIALLAKHHLGHIAITFHDLARLKLCNYIYSEGWIYARTELSPDLTMARHHPWAAFEVDEAEGIYDWRSVEVTGAIEFLSSDVTSRDWYEFENAVRLLRSAVPQILTADDPMPERIQLVRIHVDTLVGRESRSGSAESLPRV
jgi:nitroimidazol reductase NimA-like FMN-containing flavoprotein (pyridoxamine 5'-phosphate oxidase superfamily)